ncbi:MAG TPA: translocation/assembly module TamB domain-containing protein [Thermoanaerobaculia bacterium]|nr:translocation/assembly module TamB domain-containing protein [Thermoanaerobaculia bacterium]
MFGCIKGLIWVFGVGFLVLLIGIGTGWFLLGSTNFADYVRKRIETTLETRLGREVTIGKVIFVRTRPQKIILQNLRIANAPGGAAPQFALVREVELTGGIQSFWGRAVQIDRIDIRDPQVWFELLPNGEHNFPKWKTGPKRRFEIVRVDFRHLFIRGGAFSFNDRKHEIVAVAQKIASDITVTRAEGLYAGLMTSPNVRVSIQDYQPFDVTMRGGFRYTPGVLALQSIALEGRGIQAFLTGKLDPLTEAVYDLGLRARLDLPRVKEIFAVEPVLEGTIALDTRLKGKAGDFTLAGGWTAPKLVADAYELANARGTLSVTADNLTMDVQRAEYGGGTIGANYVLAKYAEPYPMRVDLRYYGISIEQLFSDWGVEGTGLRAAATGNLEYRWNKEKILEGAGEGTARLAKNAVAFSNARYPIGVTGSTDFALNNGVVTFRRAELDTDASHISLTGNLKIEDVVTDLRMAIRSTDFAELDRLAFNFAQSAGKNDFELLGFGGAGTITGTVKGPIETPQVVAQVNGSQVRYSEVLLGDADIALRYDGNRSTLTFDRAIFVDAGGRLTLTGTIEFPDRGPGPVFDIAVEANGYPAQRAIDAVGLDLKIGPGLATGRMVVAGTPEQGRATFAGLTVRRNDATLALNGTINWLPGEGNVAFDLDIAATNFPVADIAAFLDFADIPITGDLTGTLKIAGRKESLEGSGRVTIARGAVMGEPVDLASADIVFSEGRMRATNVLVRAAAGEVRGEAEIDLANERFSYTISSAALDLSRLQLLQGMQDLFGGRLVLRSTGAGTFEQPELVIEATLEEGTLRGLTLPAGSAPPSLYLAIRNGRLIIRGSVADIVSIEGEGLVGENLAVDGNVRIVIADIAGAMAMAPATASFPASGNMTIDVRLGGRLTPIEALVAEVTAPVFNLRFADHELTPAEPLRISLRNGRLSFDSFVVRRPDSEFAVTGFAEITGNKQLDVDVRGRANAALVQLFAPDIRAEGYANLSIGVDGTLSAPRVLGSAELVDAQVKFAGFPQLIDEINGTLQFRGDRIEIESVRATLGGGTVVAGGAIALNGTTPRSARITLQGNDVALRYYEGLTLEGNFTLLLTGDMDRGLLQGDIDVTRARYFRDFDIQQALLNVLLARNRVTPVSAATWQERVGLRLHLSAPGTLAVENNIADVTGSAELDVNGTIAAPVIIGEVTLDEGGTVTIQNVDYRVARGTIAFQNPFRIDPFFDVTIEGTVSGFGSSETEGGPYEVSVNLTGTLDRLTPTVTSDPPASDITLFSILGFGALGSRQPGQQASGVGLLGQSLLYQSLSSFIGSTVFPFVDSFAYDPGTLDASTGAGPRVTFEKRLSNRVRFLVVYNLEDQRSRQVIEWLVNPTWTLQLTRDEEDEYRLDARFRRRYEAHWQWGDDDRATNIATSSSVGTGAVPVATPAPALTLVNTRAADDRPIARIDFRADAGFDTNAVAQEVTLAPGEVVTIRELQSSIKNLFATGNFRDVRVDSTPGPDGVVLTFSLFLHYRIGAIEVAGVERGDRTRAQRELTVRAGEVLSLDDVDDSASAIEETLQQHGYLEAVVDPETNFDRARNVADVTFHVTPGPQATIASVILEGNTAPFTTDDLLERMSRRAGRTFSLPDAREDADRIQNFLVRRNHRRADVDFLGHTYDEATHGVTLRYRVQVGPTVQVAVSGVPRSMVRRWLPFARNQEYSEDVVERAADRITEGLQERGYFLATVDTESSLENNVWTTTFHVDPGVQYRLQEVRFSGNAKIEDGELEGVVATNPRGGFRGFVARLFRRPTGVTRTQLSDDRDSVESFYRLQGFSQATVGEPIAQTRADQTLVVDFPITEGPQTLLASVRLEGVQPDHVDEMPNLQLRPGEPLNPQLLNEDVITLQTFYANRGHVEVQVSPRVDTTEDQTTATLVYVIAEGPQVNVDEITVRGNTYTDRDVVLRRSGLEAGRPFSYTSMLEAQRELYRLGIFQRVEVQPTQTDTTVGDRDVVIQVEEGRNLTVTGSVGIRAERGTNVGSGLEVHERIAAAVAHRNLFGTGRYLGLEGVYSREEQEAFITYREPFVGRWNVPVQLQIFQSDDTTRGATQILQKGLSVEASRVARLQTRWSLRYEYKISTCEGGELCDDIKDGVIVENLDRSLLDIQISSIAPTFFWDRRDDIIDPHRGFFASASVEYAFPLFSASAGFTKEFVQGAYYIPLTERTVIALSGRAGFIQRYAKRFDEDLGRDVLRDTPLSERFTAGGETTHRAFALDRLGDPCMERKDAPVDETCSRTLRYDPDTGRIQPLGGNALLLFNAEYRFPIFGTLGGAAFVDIGNVFPDSTVRFNELRYGGGLGLRYLSPVGPLRFDVAMPYRRRWYEDRVQFFFSLGYAF